ncbi:response regulator transcription factor [Thalassotalea ponticola]|uniref:response regulator transcription factor n=1 Tax=Thalassotalea ponticola TaxID=1523392 RepID=UPI0025B3E230|nr:response regulator transcription factor [Thalassotalea ponticola]MDN3653627.1 response regulator transcription factor [Thalassotalea ponticola]
MNKEFTSASEFSTIMIVEDDKVLSSLLKSYLEKSAHVVHQVFRGDQAVRNQLKIQPDLIILDINLPGKDGFNVCHELRSTYSGPVLFLTSSASEAEQLAAFNVGADAYITKPASPQLIVAHIEALLRRSKGKNALANRQKVIVGDISLSPGEQQCEVNGKPVSLSVFEFELLSLLMFNADKVLTRDDIYKLLLGREYDGSERSVDVRLSRLRDKLERHGVTQTQIKTIWGKGYLLTAQSQSSAET